MENTFARWGFGIGENNNIDKGSDTSANARRAKQRNRKKTIKVYCQFVLVVCTVFFRIVLWSGVDHVE